MLRYIHGSTFYLFFVLPKMEAPNFESIFECISGGVNKIIVLVLVLVLGRLGPLIVKHDTPYPKALEPGLKLAI